MSVHKLGYLRMENNFIDASDTTKQMKFDYNLINTDTTVKLFLPSNDTTLVGTDTNDILTNKVLVSPFIADENDYSKKMQFNESNIAANTTVTLTVPDSNTILVGTDTKDILTNKIITDNTNTISADFLKTNTGGSINVGSTTPKKGDYLIAESSTVASWANKAPKTFFNVGGVLNEIQTEDLKFYHSKATTSTGNIVFDVSAEDGVSPLFTNLENAYINVTCRSTDLSLSSQPYATIASIDNNLLTIILQSSNTSTILSLGDTVVGLKPNDVNTIVHLSIVGI